MFFPSQFFNYNYSKALVNQSSFNTITVCIYCKWFCTCD